MKIVILAMALVLLAGCGDADEHPALSEKADKAIHYCQSIGFTPRFQQYGRGKDYYEHVVCSKDLI